MRAMVKLELSVTQDLMETVIRKYHYDGQDRRELEDAAARLLKAMRGKAGFWCGRYPERREEKLAEVVLTLGQGVDSLQDEDMQRGKLVECYMTEVLADELLLSAYGHFNRWVEKESGLHVARYHFFGGEQALPLSGMRSVLDRLGQSAVSCNEAFCLLPKKSVVFLAELTEEEGVRCASVCESCTRRDCLNRGERRREVG